MVEAKLDRYLAHALKDCISSQICYQSTVLPNPLSPSPISPSPQGLLLLGASPFHSPLELTHSNRHSLVFGNRSEEVGQIALFGNPDITVQLKRCRGATTHYLYLDPTSQKMVEEIASINEPFHLSSVIRSLKSTAFEHITFNNATFYHRIYPYDKEKVGGWYFKGELNIGESCGHLHNILTNVLHLKNTTLEVEGAFGIKGAWNRHLEPHSFMLEGFIPGASSKPVHGVHLTKIGVRLMAIRKVTHGPKPDSVLTYGFGMFGTMELDVPDSSKPLLLEYEIRESNGRVHIGASVVGDVWKHPFGVEMVVSLCSFIELKMIG
jgi:hypothetical protein